MLGLQVIYVSLLLGHQRRLRALGKLRLRPFHLPRIAGRPVRPCSTPTTPSSSVDWDPLTAIRRSWVTGRHRLSLSVGVMMGFTLVQVLLQSLIDPHLTGAFVHMLLLLTVRMLAIGGTTYVTDVVLGPDLYRTPSSVAWCRPTARRRSAGGGTNWTGCDDEPGRPSHAGAGEPLRR